MTSQQRHLLFSRTLKTFTGSYASKSCNNQKFSKTIVTNTAVLSGDGSDGKMQYIIVLNTELDQKGNWKIQGIVELPSGKWSTDIDKFKVYENLLK